MSVLEYDEIGGCKSDCTNLIIMTRLQLDPP